MRPARRMLGGIFDSCPKADRVSFVPSFPVTLWVLTRAVEIMGLRGLSGTLHEYAGRTAKGGKSYLNVSCCVVSNDHKARVSQAEPRDELYSLDVKT